jgi:hypothetical protein
VCVCARAHLGFMMFHHVVHMTAFFVVKSVPPCSSYDSIFCCKVSAEIGTALGQSSMIRFLHRRLCRVSFLGIKWVGHGVLR